MLDFRVLAKSFVTVLYFAPVMAAVLTYVCMYCENGTKTRRCRAGLVEDEMGLGDLSVDGGTDGGCGCVVCPCVCG